MAELSPEERQALVDSLERLLADHAGESAVRRLMDTPSGYDAALWRRLAEMGVVGLIIDESYGGAGASAADLERLMEVAGAALLCAPLLSSGALAASLLQALGDDEAKRRLLPGIADGSCIATAALTGPKGGWTESDVDVSAQREGGAWRLNGVAGYVTDAQIADVILVAANIGEGAGLFEVERGAARLQVAPLRTFDRTRRLAEITFDGVLVRRLEGAQPAWSAVEQALDVTRVALAGEQAGGARRVLEMTLEYVKRRIQFGRAIGSFQAIKHMAADLLLESESATSAARHAAQCLANGSPDATAAISLASFACADAYVAVTAASIQMHGGIAFTWEHPAHLYLRRARGSAQLFGAPNEQRERFLQALGA